MSRRKQIVTFSALALVGAMLLVLVLTVSLTQTDFGQSQVRRYVQSWVAGKVHGKFYVGKISGGLFNGVTIDSVEIRDDNDSLFLATGRIRIRYDARDVFDKRILLSHLDVTRPIVHIFELPSGELNFHRIFPRGRKKPHAGRAFGDYIVIDSADIRNGRVVLGLRWHPSDTLRGHKRDSVIARALGSLTRNDPGNDWPSEIRRTPTGFVHVYRFSGLDASISHARIAEPDSVGQLFRISRMKVRAADPPLDVSNVRGDVRHVGDSVLLDIAHFDLSASTGSAKGKVFWGGGQPTRYAIHIIGDSVSLNDIAWVYPTLPTTGGGRLELDIINLGHPRIMDYRVTRMDVRTTRSRLLGAMTFETGGPMFAIRDVAVEMAPLNWDLLRTLNGKPYPQDWQGAFTGNVLASGGLLRRFKVEQSRFTFADAHVPGAITRASARGELDIFEPRNTKFHGVDLDIETLDLRTLQYVNPLFPRLHGTVSGVTRLDSLWLDVRFSNADITHHDGSLPPSRVTGSGRMTFGDVLTTYDLDLQAAPLSMTALQHSYPDIPLRGDFSGPVQAKGVVNDLAVKTILTGAGGTLSYEGTWDAELPDYGAHGRGTLTNANIRTLIENPKAPRTNLTGTYAVEFVGDSIVVGTGALETSLAGTIEKINVRSSRARVRVASGIATIDTLAVRSDEARASASGTIAMTPADSGKLGFVVAVDSLSDVRRYIGANTSISPDSLRGSIRVSGEVAGSSKRLALTGTVTGRELFVEGKSVERVAGRFDLADLTGKPRGAVALRADSLHAGTLSFDSVNARAYLDTTGVATFTAALGGENGVISRIGGTAARSGDTTRVSLDSGVVTVSDGSSYSLEAPSHFAMVPGGGSLDSLLLGNQRARLAIRDVRLAGDSVRGNVRTDSVDLAILEAFLPGIRGARGSLVANVDLKGTVKQPVLEGQFRINGGAATLIGAGVPLENISADIALARDTVFVRRLSAETRRERRGALAVEGFIGMERYANPVFRLRAQAENFRIIERPGLATLDISTDEDLVLRGPYRSATVTGAIRVDRGTVSIPELITKKIVDLNDPEFAGLVDTLLARDRKLLPEAPSEFARNLSLENVRVNIGDAVWLRSSEANVKLGGSLNVTLGRNPQTGERSQLALEGTLNAVRGTYRLTLVDPFVQPTFDVESGTLRFFGTPELNPSLDIRAIHTIRQPRQQSANVRDIRVRVTIGGTLARPQLSLDNPDNLPLSQSDLLSYLVTGEPSIALDNANAEYQSQLASVAIRYGGNLLTNAIPKNVVDIVELQTAGLNLQERTSNPYYYNLLNTRAIVGKQLGNQWFLGLSTGLCVVNANNFFENFGLKLEYRFNSIYSAQAGIEPGSSELTCARANATQIQQQTPRQFGFDLFRSWRF